MKRIIVAVTNDLYTDQRVARTCATLTDGGYNVLLVGRRLPESKTVARPYATTRMRLLFNRKAVFYAEYNLRLLLKLLCSRFDMVYANDTDSLPACALAARLRGKPVLFDAHELFPEVPELTQRPRIKRFWQRIEDRWVPRVDAAVTVCQSIADVYLQRYGMHFNVVRNMPLMPENETDTDTANPTDTDTDTANQSDTDTANQSKEEGQTPAPTPFPLPFAPGTPFLLYQGAVNVGRGVDLMIDAMEHLPQYHLVVAGIGDLYESLRATATAKPWHHRIHFLGQLAPAQLQTITPRASLGLCLLENRGLNYYYSLPNRVGDFVRAGVPLLATDFPEIHRVLHTYGVGTLVPEGISGNELAQAITKALDQWQSLPPQTQNERLDRARKALDGRLDQQRLLATVRSLLPSGEAPASQIH